MPSKKIETSLPLDVPTAKIGSDPLIKRSAAYGTSGRDTEGVFYNTS